MDPYAAARRTQRAAALLATLAAATLWLAAPGLPAPALAFAVAALPVAVWALFRAPLALVLGFVCFSLFRIHEVILPLKPLRIPQLLALGALGALALMAFTGRLRAFLTPEMKLLLAFAAIVTAQMVFARNPALAFKYWSDSFSKIVLMVFAIAWLVGTPGQLRAVLRVMTVIGAGIAGVAVYNSVNGIGLIEGTRVTINRAEGSALGDPNDLAMVLLFPIGFAVSLAIGRASSLWDRAIGVAALPVLVWGTLATQSRGGLIGLVAALGVFAWNRVRSKALLAAGGAVALVALFALAGVGERATVAPGGGVVDASAEGRINAWTAAVRMALRYPLTGVGIDNFVPNFFYFTPEWHGKAKAVHSTYFQALAETGFVGFAVFSAMVTVTALAGVATWRRLATLADMPDGGPAGAGRLRDGTEALLAALAGFCVAGAFLTQALTWPFYILLALLVAARRQADGMMRPGAAP
jgi:probable O-glycosylation ligase (exosortase A-associated)